jgi:hypothetical protein
MALLYSNGRQEATVFAGRVPYGLMPDDALAINRYDGQLPDCWLFTSHMTEDEISQLVPAVARIDEIPNAIRRHDRELRESTNRRQQGA